MNSFLRPWASKSECFIHLGILVLVGEFIVMISLFEYWSGLTTVDTSLSLTVAVPQCI